MAVGFARKGFVTGRRLRKIKHPNQPVWCIRTANESWVARQGNTITITGNTVYGAGYEKLGMTVAEDTLAAGQVMTTSLAAAGQSAKTKLMRSITGMKQMNESLSAAWLRDGYITLCDGRRASPKGNHVVLNTLLQGNGAIVMKVALIIFEDWLVEQNIRARHIINCHDEWLYECTAEVAPRLLPQMKLALAQAGRLLGLTCPLSGNGSTGRTWQEVK